MDYKEILEDLLEYDEKFVAIIGCGDLVINSDNTYSFKGLTEDSFYTIIGKLDHKMILEELKEGVYYLEEEGEYEFKLLLKYYKGDWTVGEDGYYEMVHEEFNFIQTFAERERENKLSILLDFNIDELFK
jgi:hypothetical protein